MPLNRHLRPLRRALQQDAEPAATLACLFMAALAASCVQSGFATWALAPASISGALMVAGLVRRLRPMLAIPVRVTRTPRKPLPLHP